jgi:hypothetical protein
MLVKLPLYDLTELIIGKGMVVHDHFGPGLFETVYKREAAFFESAEDQKDKCRQPPEPL